MTERQLPDVVVFDRMSPAIRHLIQHSTIAGAVNLHDRASMIGAAGIVTQIEPLLPPFAWSDSEQVLWCFIASLAGQGQVNLQELVAYFRGSGQMVQIIDALESIAGLVDAR